MGFLLDFRCLSARNTVLSVVSCCQSSCPGYLVERLSDRCRRVAGTADCRYAYRCCCLVVFDFILVKGKKTFWHQAAYSMCIYGMSNIHSRDYKAVSLPFTLPPHSSAAVVIRLA